MLNNYLKTALRNLKKNKLFTLINIFGLAIGISVCLLIWHYVNYEKSYDTFHADSDRIYRIRYERYSEDGSAVKFASCCPPAGKLMRERFPEIEKLGRMFKYTAIVSFNNTRFLEERIFFSEPDIFEIFNFNFVEGDPLKSLQEPKNAFISQSIAKKYFGDKNPVGQLIKLDQKSDYQIAGIFEDIPDNSHIKFDIILPWKNLEISFGPDYYQSWGHSGTFTYVLLKPATNLAVFNQKIADLVDAEFGEALRYYNLRCFLPLQPLTQIHLTSHFAQEYEVNGDADSVNYLFIIAIFIIIIAWVNYINLSTARSLTRAREVGLRKVVGASRKQLIIQFFTETFIINTIAIIFSVAIIELALPWFNKLTGTSAEFGIWLQYQTWISFIGMYLFGIFISGLYPVLALSAFKPERVLKGKPGHPASGIGLRKALVIFQFFVAFLLIIATFAVYHQITFMKNQELGFDSEHMLVVKIPRIRTELFRENIISFKETLKNNAFIEKSCVVTEVPGKQIYWDAGGILRVGADERNRKNYQIVGIDYDFADVFDVKFVSGRNFNREFTSDQDALILNEKAVEWMGFDNPQEALNQQVNYWNQIYTIVGVLENYHQQSLKAEFEPHLYRLMPTGRKSLGVFAIKTVSENISETVKYVENLYQQFFPGNTFNYFFLDEYFNQQYKQDEKFGTVFGIFSVFTIFIAILGILGLSSFMAIQRTKEIGIRKVLGAGISSILILLSRDFIILILLAFIISLPLAIWGINFWLESFASRFEPDPFLFVFPFLMVTAVSITAISSIVVKAAMTNPVDVLKYE